MARIMMPNAINDEVGRICGAVSAEINPHSLKARYVPSPAIASNIANTIHLYFISVKSAQSNTYYHYY